MSQTTQKKPQHKCDQCSVVSDVEKWLRIGQGYKCPKCGKINLPQNAPSDWT